MVTKDKMEHVATRAFVIEELLETIYELVTQLEDDVSEIVPMVDRKIGHATYRARHLLHGASGLAGALAMDLSDLMGECPASSQDGEVMQ